MRQQLSPRAQSPSQAALVQSAGVSSVGKLRASLGQVSGGDLKSHHAPCMGVF